MSAVTGAGRTARKQHSRLSFASIMNDGQPIARQRGVTVIGLGYVGLPVALAFAGAGNTVIGSDREKWHILMERERRQCLPKPCNCRPDSELNPCVSAASATTS